MAFLIGGANSAADTGYNIDNSCRFEDGDSPELYRDIVTATNNKICTLSFWVKRSNIGFGNVTIMSAGHNDDLNSDAPSNPFIQIGFEGDDELRFHGYSDENTATFNIQPNRVFRDVSAWYHFVFTFDTTDGTAADRIKIYINGSRETSLKTTTYPDQNLVLAHNQSSDFDFMIGNYAPYDSQYFDGYLADVAFVDGTALTSSSFGEVDEDSGIWKPKKPDVTWGNNGFFLEFKESAVGSGSASTIGADTSGNTNHLTSSGLAATDQCTDTPTNNFATLNPLARANGTYDRPTFSEGNCKVVSEAVATNYNSLSSISTFMPFYFEVKLTATQDGDDDERIGIADAGYSSGSRAYSALYRGDGNIVVTGETTDASNQTFADGDIIGVACDFTTNFQIKFYHNGSIQATMAVGASYRSYLPMPEFRQFNVGTWEVNFGNPTFTISSGNADAEGYGNFEYAVPSGHYALCTKNLAEYG